MMAKVHGPIYGVNMISLFCEDRFRFSASEVERPTSSLFNGHLWNFFCYQLLSWVLLLLYLNSPTNPRSPRWRLNCGALIRDISLYCELLIKQLHLPFFFFNWDFSIQVQTESFSQATHLGEFKSESFSLGNVLWEFYGFTVAPCSLI